MNNIKKPFNHYFVTVADYFINKDFDVELIDSHTYKQALLALDEEGMNEERHLTEKLSLIRNFLGGLTNLKIIELYKKIQLFQFEEKLGYTLENGDKLVEKNSVSTFEKKLHKYAKRIQ